MDVTQNQKFSSDRSKLINGTTWSTQLMGITILHRCLFFQKQGLSNTKSKIWEWQRRYSNMDKFNLENQPCKDLCKDLKEKLRMQDFIFKIP